MSEYLVSWLINIDADTPEEAAAKAREIQLDPHSMATIFDVMPQAIDGRFYHHNRVRLDLEVELEEASVH
ncbi:MAG TPA: hypothetical protein PKZ27_03050 [Rhodocyclaceae bacterium]|nr:hypothetical protein [Burkholderiaceae bacterium]HRP74544.1 hypothetical protein [Rhodocyclaceae bacterium]